MKLPVDDKLISTSTDDSTRQSEADGYSPPDPDKSIRSNRVHNYNTDKQDDEYSRDVERQSPGKGLSRNSNWVL